MQAMADQARTEPDEDPANPYLAPTRELGQLWGTGDLELEAIRRANLADEAYLKILVRANFVIAAMICAFGGYYLSFPIRHVLGQIDAQWVGKPNWIAFYGLLVIMPILSILAGYGLHRRKPWAILVETLVVLSLLIFWVFPLLNRDEPTPMMHFVVGAVFGLCVTTPFLNIWDLKDSAVFLSAYARVVKATSYIRVKPKLPLTLRLMMGAFALVFLGLAAYLALG
jgi:hypothetical protein